MISLFFKKIFVMIISKNCFIKDLKILMPIKNLGTKFKKSFKFKKKYYVAKTLRTYPIFYLK
jgi:hypothetical protein